MINKTYVAVFSQPLTQTLIEQCVTSWLERFESVEQLVPENGFGADYGLAITKLEDLMWAEHLQFRVSQGIDFTWIYVTMNRRAIETTGLPTEDISLYLDVLLELPSVTELVDGIDEHRLDELEKEGIL